MLCRPRPGGGEGEGLKIRNINMSWEIKYICFSHIGRIRRNNEDNFICLSRYMDHDNNGTEEPVAGAFLSDEPQLVGVFDGMGGEELGEMASYLAAETAAMCSFEGDPEEALTGFCRFANDRICQYADENNVSSMGTTAAVLLFRPDGVRVCNVGDSRIYLYSRNRLTQVSVDHVVPMEGRRKPPLSQNLGIPEEEMVIEPYIAFRKYRKGDTWLICSDGLTDMVPEDEIAGILKGASHRDAARLLRDRALENGGRDNVTVLVCRTERKHGNVWKYLAGSCGKGGGRHGR